GAEAVGAAGAVAEVGARNDCGTGDAGDSASAEGPKLSTSSAVAPSADAPAVARLRRDGVSSSMRRPPASGVEVGPDADGGGPRAFGSIGTSPPEQVLDVTAGLPVIPSRACSRRERRPRTLAAIGVDPAITGEPREEPPTTRS